MKWPNEKLPPTSVEFKNVTYALLNENQRQIRASKHEISWAGTNGGTSSCALLTHRSKKKKRRKKKKKKKKRLG